MMHSTASCGHEGVNLPARSALFDGGGFLSPDLWKGGLPMVTYTDLIQIGILIVGICNLIIQISKKK